MEESTGSQVSTDTPAVGESQTPGGRRGPTWRGWFLSILVAILLSVTATLLLGGSGASRLDSGNGPAAGAGTDCCPHMSAGK